MHLAEVGVGHGREHPATAPGTGAFSLNLLSVGHCLTTDERVNPSQLWQQPRGRQVKRNLRQIRPRATAN